ncbi:MAG: DUF6683 family protein [Fimbriimonas sp.]
MMLSALLSCSLLIGSFGQGLAAENPVQTAALQIGTTGLSQKAAPASSPTAFKPSGSRPYVETYLKKLFDSDSDRAQVSKVVGLLIDDFEKQMKPRSKGNDASAALAFATTTLTALAGKTTTDEVFLDLIDRIQATLDRPEVRKATDAQKQEFYENCFAALTFTITLSQAPQAEVKARAKEVAGAFLTQFIGASTDRFVITATTLRLTPLPKPVVAKPPVASGSLAPGFTFSAPDGWVKKGDWYVKEMPDGNRTSSALLRFPAAIPASGNMGDALGKLWVREIPAEGKDRLGSMVYRRYVGDQVVAQFVGGRVVEQKRPFDTAFTLFLVDCKTHWQPVVVALTYDGPSTVGGEMSSGFSFPGSMKEAEKFLATFRCPAAKGQPLADAASLAGDYSYGTGSKLDWVNINTGATSMTFITYGGTLNLKPKGTFTYTYSSATGRDGLANFGGIKGSGKWTIQGDILTCNYSEYDQGDGYKVKQHQYRIAGLTMFLNGVKVAVLLKDLDKPVNLTTVGESSSWYSTAKSGG